jgi:hypothetical protein
LNRPVKGVLTLRIDKSLDQTSSPFAIEAGRLEEVQVPCRAWQNLRKTDTQSP